MELNPLAFHMFTAQIYLRALGLMDNVSIVLKRYFLHDCTEQMKLQSLVLSFEAYLSLTSGLMFNSICIIIMSSP